MAKIKKHYDAVIVGGGLSGLLSARILNSKSKTFLIIDPSDRLGGRLTNWMTQNQETFPSNLNLYSTNRDKEIQLFSWLEATLDTRLIDGSLSTQSFHFKDGSLKPLSGFGDKNCKALDEYNDLCFHNEKAKLTQLPQAWIDRLLNDINDENMSLNSEVTNLEIKDKNAHALTINGKTRVEFENLIWASPIQNLLKVISAQALSSSELKKLKRPQKVFDAVTLNVFHPSYESQKLTEIPKDSPAKNWNILSNPQIYCLYGSQDEYEPVIGTLSSRTSCWMAMVPSERSLDHEFVTKLIKNMKKQIKRPFPELFKNEDVEEGIRFSEGAYGFIDLKQTSEGFLKDVHNIYGVSSLCSPEHGLYGLLDRVYNLEKSLN